MRGSRKRAVAWLVAAAAVLAGCMATTASAVTVPTAPSTAPTTPETIVWTDCADGFQCATVRVPRDHSKPEAGTVGLSLIKKPATGPTRIGTLFTNPGGPGGSGVDFLRGAAPIFAGVNDRFDLVSWDPRGTPGSEPIDCLTPAQRDARWPRTNAFPTIAGLAETTSQADELIDGCLAADADGDLEYFTTENAARDLDALRALVGDRRLTYVGFSYGTYLGTMYAALFPGNARALVLDGPLNPTQYTLDPLQNLLDQSAGFEDALNRFFAWCRTSPVCRFQGGRKAYDRLLAGLARKPLPATAAGDPRPVLQIDLQTATVLPLYARQLWPLLAETLTAAQAGDGSLAQAISDASRGRADDGTFATGLEAFVQTSCVDLTYPRSAKVFEDYGRRAAKSSPFLGLNNLWSESAPGYVCALWPVRSDEQYSGPFHYASKKKAAPALVVGTTHDPATPYQGALALTAQLGNARLLTMEGDGHTAYGGNSSCIDPAVDAYLESLTLPKAGTVCAQDLVVDPEPEPVAGGGSLASARQSLVAGLTRVERRSLLRAELAMG